MKFKTINKKKIITLTVLVTALTLVTCKNIYSASIKENKYVESKKQFRKFVKPKITAKPTIKPIHMKPVKLNKTVTKPKIKVNKPVVKPVKKPITNNKKIFVSAYEIEMIARTVQAEALGESYRGKVGVSEVIINRMKLNHKSARRIVSSRGQFNGYNNRLYHKKLNSDCVKAVKKALNGSNIVKGATSFCDLRYCRPEWIYEFQYIIKIGNHTFYRDNSLYKNKPKKRKK